MRTPLSLLAAAVAFASVAGCSRSVPPASHDDAAAGPPPAAEFLLAAGDSTYWVTTAGGRTRVRGAPLTLAHYDGRFYEVYVGDDDRSFYDALLVGQRIFRRDLLSGDSAQVYVDRDVAAEARRWAAEHPDEDPLGENEEASENPRLSLTAEVELVASHGPYLTYEVHTERETRGQPDGYDARRAVVDLRSGRRVAVADVVGSRRAPAVLAEGRRRFAAALDSLRTASDERAMRARQALAHFVFDPTSFGLDDVDRAPAIAFLARGRGFEAGGYTLPIAPIVVSPTPPWWSELRETLPAPAAALPAGPSVRWARAGAEVEARYDSVHAVYTLLLRAPRDGGATGEWTLGRLHGPARQLYWLDAPPMDSAMRRALARAFDESALYSDDARTVAWTGARPRRANRVWGGGCRSPRAPRCGTNPGPRLAARAAVRHPARHTPHPAVAQ